MMSGRYVTRALLLAIAGVTAFSISAAYADQDGREPAPATQPKAIGQMDPFSLVRSISEAMRPAKTGLWQQIVNQSYLTPLAKAEKLLFHGQYRQAEGFFRSVLKGNPADDERTRAQEGLLESLTLENGGWRLEEVQQQLPQVAASDRKTLIEARWLAATGRRGATQDMLAKWLAAQPKLTAATSPIALAAMNLHARLFEEMGQFPAAAAIYERVAALAAVDLPDDAATQTEVAVAIERAAALKGESRRVHQDVLTRLSKAAEIDRTYWPARLATARILLAHHNTQEGGQELDAVFDLNPNALEARELEIRYAIDNYAFEPAEAAIKDLVKNQTETPDVAAWRGRLLLKQRLPEQALPILQQAFERNPDMNDARGWLAAAYLLRRQDEAAGKLLDDTSATPATLFEAAEVLRDARQFTTGEKLYQRAAALAPWWAEPHAALAELYMETGQDEQAKQSYEQAFAIDPYNKRSYNQLQLLDDLTTQFAQIESEHFIVRFQKEDALLGRLASEYLERIYPEVTGYYQTPLKHKTKIEFYPTHEQFGVRTTGMPWIGTVGASTGRVIAMDVPRIGQGRLGLFDWARVLRHEFTHTVTLEMTRNRIPHWLTEACAQNEEQSPRDWDSCQLLASNLRAGTLFKIQDLNWGFIRPKRSIDRQLAYLESHWLFDYLLEKYGYAKMIDFLRAYGNGMTDTQAVQSVYGTDVDPLYVEFLAWARNQVRQWGLDPSPLPTREEIEKRVQQNPQSADAKADLAMLLLSAGKLPEAEKLLRDAIAADATHIKARELLGMLLVAEKRSAEAKGILEQVLADDSQRPATLRTLAQLAMADKQYAEAERYFTRLQNVRPLEQASYESLAGIYLIQKRAPDAIAQLRELQAHEQHDDRISRRLAELLQSPESGSARNLQDAALMAGKAIHINPYNPLNHALLGDILMQQNKPAEAAAAFADATSLQPKVSDYWLKRAQAERAAGNTAAADESEKQARDLRK